jgi:hypothetical protein
MRKGNDMRKKLNLEAIGITVVMLAILFFTVTIMSAGLAPESEVGIWSLRIWDF